MAVRLRLRIRTTEGRAVEAIALLNSGFEAPTPQLIAPLDVANLYRMPVHTIYFDNSHFSNSLGCIII